jgi:tetratricopeptide (TPR) repeat protein
VGYSIKASHPPISRFRLNESHLGVSPNQQIAALPQSQGLNAVDYFVIAVDKSQKGDFAEAKANYNQAIKLDPKYLIAYIGLGILKADRLNDPQGALATYNQAIKVDPNFELAYIGRGVLKAEKLNDFAGSSD